MKKALCAVAIVSIFATLTWAKPVAPDPVTVVIFTRELLPGDVVRMEDLARLDIDERFATASMVKPDSANFVVGQPIMVPAFAGDVAQWPMFDVPAEGAPDCLEATKSEASAADLLARIRASVEGL